MSENTHPSTPFPSIGLVPFPESALDAHTREEHAELEGHPVLVSFDRSIPPIFADNATTRPIFWGKRAMD